MAGGNPLGTVTSVRRMTAVPLIVVGGDAREAAACLDAGADAWLGAELEPSLVAAQVDACARRADVSVPPPEGKARVGELELDLASRVATVNGRRLTLTRREFDLLRVLTTHVGEALTRDRILGLAWGSRYVGEPKTVDVHVAWLRPKLDDSRLRLTTLRGIGYRLDVLEAHEHPQGAPPNLTAAATA